MNTEYQLSGETREVFGTAASRRLRRENKVPAVMYGGGKKNVNLMFSHNELMHKLERSGFHAAILSINVGKKSEQAILRDVNMHPYKQLIMHADFQRVLATETINIKVPLRLLAADVAPGIKSGGIVSHLITEVEISCLPKNLPEYLEIDLAEMELNETAHLSQIELPPDVEIISLSHGGEDLAVAAITPAKVEAEEPLEEAEGEEDIESESDADAETGADSEE